MSAYTLFVSPQVIGFKDNVSEPTYSKEYNSFDQQIRYNVKVKKVQELMLNASDTYTLTFSNYASSSWSVIYMTVVGSATLDTAALDTNNVTVINGHTPCYGTSVLPGKLILSTYNVTAFTITGITNGTVVELFGAISEEDS